MPDGVYYFPVYAEHGRKVVGKGLGPYHPSELAARTNAMSSLREGRCCTGSTVTAEVYSARGKDMNQALWRVRDMIDQDGSLAYPASSQ